MKRVAGTRMWMALIALAVVGSQGAAAAGEQRHERSLGGRLSGFQEAPTVFSPGRGDFEMRIARDEQSFDFKLRYDGLEGAVTQAHIHVGQIRVSGGISIWLCQTAAAAAPAAVAGITPTCPGPNSGEVEGTVTAAHVIGPATQGVAAGEFAEILRAIRLGLTYANVHTARSPGGEIRGQILDDHDDHDRGHDR